MLIWSCCSFYGFWLFDLSSPRRIYCMFQNWFVCWPFEQDNFNFCLRGEHWFSTFIRAPSSLNDKSSVHLSVCVLVLKNKGYWFCTWFPGWIFIQCNCSPLTYIMMSTELATIVFPRSESDHGIVSLLSLLYIVYTARCVASVSV